MELVVIIAVATFLYILFKELRAAGARGVTKVVEPTAQQSRTQWQSHAEYLQRELATANLAIQQLDARIQAEMPARPYTPRRCARKRVAK